MLSGKAIVVTGGSRGIGLAIAQACVDAGARVVLAARKPDELQHAVSQLGPQATAIPTHTGKTEQVQALFAHAVAEFGRVDGLVNNAATNPYFGPLIDTPPEAFDKTVEVNLKGYLACCKELVKQSRANQTPAAIVNIASIMGMRAAPMQGVYGMTKAAVISMTQTLAAELGTSAIRVNAIAPGLVETKFAAALISHPTLRDYVNQRSALKRHAQPSELGAAAVFLLSDAASFVTGSVLTVDGGFTSS